MRSQALSTLFTDIGLTLIGLMIFVVFFVLMIFFVFRKSGKGHYEKMAQLPLEENQDPSEQHSSKDSNNSKGTPNE